MDQIAMPIFGDARRPNQVPWDLVTRCKDGKDAILLCINLRHDRYSMADLAAKLGIDKGHFSRILSGQGHFPDEKRVRLMEICGNYAPLQYEAWRCGFGLESRQKTPEEMIQQLQEENARLRACVA